MHLVARSVRSEVFCVNIKAKHTRGNAVHFFFLIYSSPADVYVSKKPILCSMPRGVKKS